MTPNPFVITQSYDAGNDNFVLQCSQNIDPDSTLDAASIVAESLGEDFLTDWNIDSIDGTTVTIHAEGTLPNNPGIVAGPGRMTAIKHTGLIGADNGLPLLPFANRFTNPRVLSVAFTGGGTGATIVWSSPMAQLPFNADTEIQFKTTAGQGKKRLLYTAGDNTDTWTMTLANTTNAVQPGMASISSNAAQQTGTGTGNIEFEGPVAP